MHIEQVMTELVGRDSLNIDPVFVSTSRYTDIDECEEDSVTPDQTWETLVGFKDLDIGLSLFEEFPDTITQFRPVYCSSHLLGSERDPQHQYAVKRLLTMGYKIAKHVDNRQFWNKQLEGIDGIDDFS